MILLVLAAVIWVFIAFLTLGDTVFRQSKEEGWSRIEVWGGVAGNVVGLGILAAVLGALVCALGGPESLWDALVGFRSGEFSCVWD